MLLADKAVGEVGQSSSLLDVEPEEADFEGMSWPYDVSQNSKYYATSCVNSDLQNTIIWTYTAESHHFVHL